MKNAGALYIVATPIGNLSDISQRALETLERVDLIAAEDTRYSTRLLTHFGITTPMVSYHDHGGEIQVERLLSRLERGQAIALISDAGTPLVSDPGYRLVSAARVKQYTVVPVPGPCALITALSAAGLPSDRFVFEGFPPAKKSGRLGLFSALRSEVRTLLFYESPHRIRDSLADMREAFGPERQCVVARELTKTFETFIAGTLNEVLSTLSGDLQQQRGEFVVMLAGYEAPPVSDSPSAEGRRVLAILLRELPLKQACALAAEISGERKNKLYQWALSQGGAG